MPGPVVGTNKAWRRPGRLLEKELHLCPLLDSDVRASLGNRGGSHGSPLIVGQRAFWG